MHTFDFNAAIALLNKGVYIDVSNITTYVKTGEKALAVKRRTARRKAATSAKQRNEADSLDLRFLDDEVQGTKDEFLMAIPYPWVPEYDELDGKTGRVIKRGWRSAALSLVRKNICTIEQARKVFKCRSLGESTYDKLGYEGKLRLCRTL
jgi:hypothetical protein